MSLKKFNPETISPRNVSFARQVFEEHGDFIRKIIRFHTGNKLEAEDLFQDLFLFLVLKPLPQNVRDMRSFLYRIITARIIDELRHEYRREIVVHKYAQKKKESIAEFHEDSLVKNESAERMFDLVHKHLPRNEAMVIILKYKHGFNISETAEKMGIKPRSVSHYLSTAISKIRYVIADRFEETL
ncbi:MAG: sigma-70 family RNA polymerase sigma factor [Spirochaetes bacterium]|nr:sigma-70 family RNA polymerase sigma factor [Spirochaetota bacterium]